MDPTQRVPDRPATADEEIEKAVDDSFPASDPPAWSGGRRNEPDAIDPDNLDPTAESDDRSG